MSKILQTDPRSGRGGGSLDDSPATLGRGGVGCMPGSRPGGFSVDLQGQAQVSCRITITKMMTTRTPTMVPINPLFIADLLLSLVRPALSSRLSPVRRLELQRKPTAEARLQSET